MGAHTQREREEELKKKISQPGQADIGVRNLIPYQNFIKNGQLFSTLRFQRKDSFIMVTFIEINKGYKRAEKRKEIMNLISQIIQGMSVCVYTCGNK